MCKYCDVPHTPPHQALLGAREASVILGRNKVTVIRWAADGTLPCLGQLGGSNGALVFHRAAVDKLARKLARQEQLQ